MKKFKVFKFNADGKYLKMNSLDYIDATDNPLEAKKMSDDSSYINGLLKYMDGKIVTIELRESEKMISTNDIYQHAIWELKSIDLYQDKETIQRTIGAAISDIEVLNNELKRERGDYIDNHCQVCRESNPSIVIEDHGHVIGTIGINKSRMSIRIGNVVRNVPIKYCWNCGRRLS